jgi:hypothetical protein
MTDDKNTTDNKIDELVNIVNKHRNPDSPTSPIGSTRTYTSPLMGTSARAAKRRMDSDSGPIRIEGTDTYNQHLQHHYQNVRQILEDQQQTSNVDTTPESRQSFSAKREFFEQRFKTPPLTYDTPPRQQEQKIITTSNIHDRTSSSSNESPSVDRVLEQAVELQKLSNVSSTKSETQLPFVIERTEQYQVFLDSANHEVRRTPSISRTSIIPITKSGHATDLDQAQAQIERTTDDHQAIKNLTRALQEHNVTTINEYKRLPSQTNPITPSLSSPSAILQDRTNLSKKNDYSVLDALLNNPVGTMDDKYNQLLSLRSNDIVTNLRNPEYLNSLKQPKKTSKKPEKKQPKEKKSKKKPSPNKDPVEQTLLTPLVDTSESLPTKTTEPITTTTTVSTEQTPLIDPKETKKQKKENKKQVKTKPKPKPKTKSKSKSKNDDYQVIDAILGSPISIRLPDSYLTKYNLSAPLSQSSSLPSIPPPPPVPSTTVVTTTPTSPPPVQSTTVVTTTSTSSPLVPSTTVVTTTPTSSSKDKKTPHADKNQTLFHLVKIVNDLKAHHATAAATVNIPTTPSKEPVVTSKPAEPVVKQVVHQQRSDTTSKQTEARPLSEPIKPRILYRYMDEQGRILKISSTPPSQLREQPAQQYTYRNTEPPYFYGRHIVTDDDRRHPLPQYEQRATWQGEPKLPTTLTREDFELRDKRVPQLIEQSIPTSRAVPVTVEHERPSRPSSQQQQSSRTYHFPNQQNVKLAWLPLSYPPDPQYIPVGTAGYDTDSTISERSANFRPYDYGPNDPHYRYSNRPLYHDYYNRSPGPTYYSPPPLLLQGGRGISPEYGGVGGVSRNYIEVFRGGDFRETKPSEVYSLPLTEHIRTSPILPTSTHNSRYDQYQSERYGSIPHHDHIPTSSSQQNFYYSNTLPHSRYQQTISPSNVYTSSYYTHRNPYSHHTVQSSPNPEYTNYIRQSKSFDYRPLRTKLQREYRITPNLLVDEWDYPQTPDNIKYSTTTSTTNRSGLSSPDDVFITNRTNKA